MSQVLKRGASATAGDGNQNAVEVQGLFDLIDSNKDGKGTIFRLFCLVDKYEQYLYFFLIVKRLF